MKEVRLKAWTERPARIVEKVAAEVYAPRGLQGKDGEVKAVLISKTWYEQLLAAYTRQNDQRPIPLPPKDDGTGVEANFDVVSNDGTARQGAGT